jgi:hypothetical protein
LYEFDEKICGGTYRIPSALEFSAPAAPRLPGPPSHKNAATPLHQIIAYRRSDVSYFTIQATAACHQRYTAVVTTERKKTVDNFTVFNMHNKLMQYKKTATSYLECAFPLLFWLFSATKHNAELTFMVDVTSDVLFP